MEADKLFKTLGTGLCPNTLKVVKSRFTQAVPNFLTEDERSILITSSETHQRIRYWFYPDNIGTVTNGSIGVIDNWQFLADAERMDTKVKIDSAVRETIGHLNQNCTFSVRKCRRNI